MTPHRLIFVAVACSLLGACAGQTGPRGTVGTESFVATSLREYGVFDGRRVQQTTVDPEMKPAPKVPLTDGTPSV
ncbi:MAG: hypothetical protein AB7U61_16820 [Methylocystis sp.]